jgi:HAD superfamily hydrolase (TIGR01509 family)
MRFADLDAVTVDGFGTLLELENPVGRLSEALAARSVRRAHSEIAEAFAAEARFYRPRSHLGRDAVSLASLRRDCVRVFLDAIASDLEPESFVDAFIDSLVFHPVAGSTEALERLRGASVRIAVVSNWDCSLPGTLERIGLAPYLDTVVTSAEAGAPKPGVEPYLLALERLGARASRSLHIGDEADDELGARAAGMYFDAAPFPAAVGALA